MTTAMDSYPRRAQLTHTTFASAGVDGTAPVLKIMFTYRSDDPYAVYMEVGGKEWSFARDLLNTGVLRRTGDGDVCVFPVPGKAHRVAIALTSPTGHIELHLDVQDVADWTASTYDLVPDGAEVIDWDREMGHLAGGVWE